MSVVAFRKSDSDTTPAVVPNALPACPEPAMEEEDFSSGLRRPIAIGSALVGIFVIGFGVWASVAPLASAVVAPGVVRVEDNRKTVAHRDGGIIEQILVRDGQSVRAGDVLLRMDEVQARSAFEVYDNQYRNLLARRARFIAEGSGVSELAFPEALTSRSDEPDVAALMSEQRSLFTQRTQTLNNLAEILNQRLAQLDTRIEGYQAQIDSLSEQNELVGQELEGTRSLADRGYTARTRVLELERVTAGLVGQRGALVAQIAEAQQAKGETQLQINRLYDDRLAEGSQGLSDVQAELANILPRLQASRATLDLSELRAPVSGTVFGLTQYTEGGVVAAGERILDIVPEDGEMIIQANVNPADIAELQSGMEAEIKLTAYNQATTPSVFGEVVRISADRVVQDNGAAYYLADIRVRPESLARAAQNLRLYPGMPAEVIVPTSERTALQYLMSPITNSMSRAFREQ